MENFKKIEEMCKKKFNDGSFGILTPIFNPAYPSLKYVFSMFLLIRTIFCLCALGLDDVNIHLEFFMVLIVIMISLVVSTSFESGYTVEAEPMELLIPLMGLVLFIAPISSIFVFGENVSSAYYVLFGIDFAFFFYTVYIRIKEIKYNKDPRKYLLKHDTKRMEYNKFDNIIDETGYFCRHMLEGLNEDEKSILEESFKSVEDLYRSSYIYRLDIIIHDVNVFLETSDFIKDLYHVLKAYKKTKPSNNLEYLEKVRDSINEFYETIKNRNENMDKEKFMGAMEKFKVRVGGI